jgi:hypothetical protein
MAEMRADRSSRELDATLYNASRHNTKRRAYPDDKRTEASPIGDVTPDAFCYQENP